MRRWLLVFALAVAIGHHIGVGLGPIGDVGHTGTRWADWIDLLVPYVVVGSAAMALVRARTDRTGWALLILSAVAYAQGHGIHLAANSVGNAVGGHVAHIWDEEVSHWIWYAGLSGMVLALIRAIPRLTIPIWAWAVPILFGFTWFDNTIEGGVPWLGIAVSLALGGYAFRRRLLPIAFAYGVALLLLGVWGIWQQGFPQFSQLGWI
jgi:hypothetical protein